MARRKKKARADARSFQIIGRPTQEPNETPDWDSEGHDPSVELSPDEIDRRVHNAFPELDAGVATFRPGSGEELLRNALGGLTEEIGAKFQGEFDGLISEQMDLLHDRIAYHLETQSKKIISDWQAKSLQVLNGMVRDTIKAHLEPWYHEQRQGTLVRHRDELRHSLKSLFDKELTREKERLSEHLQEEEDKANRYLEQQKKKQRAEFMERIGIKLRQEKLASAKRLEDRKRAGDQEIARGRIKLKRREDHLTQLWQRRLKASEKQEADRRLRLQYEQEAELAEARLDLRMAMEDEAARRRWHQTMDHMCRERNQRLRSRMAEEDRQVQQLRRKLQQTEAEEAQKRLIAMVQYEKARADKRLELLFQQENEASKRRVFEKFQAERRKAERQLEEQLSVEDVTIDDYILNSMPDPSEQEPPARRPKPSRAPSDPLAGAPTKEPDDRPAARAQPIEQERLMALVDEERSARKYRESLLNATGAPTQTPPAAAAEKSTGASREAFESKKSKWKRQVENLVRVDLDAFDTPHEKSRDKSPHS